MKIYISGDTHGIQDAGKLARIRKDDISEDDYIIICGDCGVLWHEDFTKEFVEFFESLKATVLFIDGNHENYDMLNALPVVEILGGKAHKVSERIYHLLRGEIFTIGGRTFLAFGGADSHDKVFRIPHKSWWKEERITEQNTLDATNNLQKYGNKVDYVLTHSPSPKFKEKIIDELVQCGEEIPYYLRDKLLKNTPSEWQIDKLEKIVEYRAWFSGHLHADIHIGKNYSLYDDVLTIKL